MYMGTKFVVVDLSACFVTQLLIEPRDPALSRQSRFFRTQLPRLFLKKPYCFRAEIFSAEIFEHRYSSDNAYPVFGRKYPSRGGRRSVRKYNKVQTLSVGFVKFISEALFLNKNLRAYKARLIGQRAVKFVFGSHDKHSFRYDSLRGYEKGSLSVPGCSVQ